MGARGVVRRYGCILPTMCHYCDHGSDRKLGSPDHGRRGLQCWLARKKGLICPKQPGERK